MPSLPYGLTEILSRRASMHILALKQGWMNRMGNIDVCGLLLGLSRRRSRVRAPSLAPCFQWLSSPAVLQKCQTVRRRDTLAGCRPSRRLAEPRWRRFACRRRRHRLALPPVSPGIFVNLAMRYASSRPHWAFPPLTWAACASDARRRLSFDRLVPLFSPQARARPRVRSSRAARHWPRPAQSRSTEVYLAITKNKKAALGGLCCAKSEKT